MKSTLGPDFLNRTLRTAGIVLLIIMPFGIYYYGFYSTLAVFSGGVWGIVNFIFLSAVIRSAIRPEGVDGRRLALVLLVKFPLLYAAGYALLMVPVFDPVFLLIGSSIILIVMALKAAGRLYLGLDDRRDNSNRLREMV